MSFRFNNGRGAITCDRCNIIVKYGYYTPEQHPEPHYCEDFGLECEPRCTCGVRPEHMGEGRYGKWHSQSCPMFDGDHPEICKDSTEQMENKT